MTKEEYTQFYETVRNGRCTLYIGVCSCGEYRSSGTHYPGHAEQRALGHARAKHGKTNLVSY